MSCLVLSSSRLAEACSAESPSRYSGCDMAVPESMAVAYRRRLPERLTPERAKDPPGAGW